MPKKLLQYYIYKFSTDRLKNSKYHLEINLRDARQNGEVVSIGESQLIRTLNKLKNASVTQEEIENLFTEKKRIKSRSNNKENRRKLVEIEKEIDNKLFIKEMVSILINDVRHYEKINKDGLWINGKLYKRLIMGSGNARRNVAIMIDADYYEKLYVILDNDRNKEIPINPAKYSAYFGLYNSAGYSVSTPRVAVIKDYKAKKKCRLDVVVEDESDPRNDEIIEQDLEIEQNLFDGQGLISPEFVKKWSEELGLDYLPGAFIIRGPFLKGLCATFDFHKFAYEIADKYELVDVWNNTINIWDVDCILTQSQFKLWDSYLSYEEYSNSCKKNELGWSVSRYAPKEDGTHTTTNYQFLQVLDLNDKQIELLCQKTVDFFNEVIADDPAKTMLYLMGESYNYDDFAYDKIADSTTKALILNNDLLGDNYIKSRVRHTLEKKIKESYLGKLIVDGNFSFIIADCYALAQHAFGLTVTGLLNEGQAYSGFWRKQNIDKVVAMRAPLTHFSEPVILDLKSHAPLSYWYEYQTSGTVINVFGLEMEKMADADKDGDLVLTTRQTEMIDGVMDGYIPITYEKRTAKKIGINKDDLWQTDCGALFTKVGYITNLATSMIAMMYKYPEGSNELKELQKRMELSRFLQGMSIDAAKLGVQKPIYEHWVKFTKITPEMTNAEIERIEFDNSLLIEQRPYFMRYLYSTYSKRYQSHREIYNTMSIVKFGIEIDDLLSKQNLTEEEQKVVDNYYRYSYFIETPCVMNKICWHMEKEMKKLKSNVSKSTFDAAGLIDLEFIEDKSKILSMEKLYKKYKENKRVFSRSFSSTDEEDFRTLEQYIKYIKQEAIEISSNSIELANLALYICYVKYPKSNKDFAWRVFGEEIVDLVLKDHDGIVRVPVKDDEGDIEYLGSHYRIAEMDISADIQRE